MRLGRPASPPSHSSRRAEWRRWAFAAVGLFTAGQIAAAQAATGAITGRVTDAGNGVPMVGVSVRVVGTQIGSQTADDGRYTIRGITPGVVTIQFNRIGYESRKASVNVTPGQTSTQDATMAQAAFSLSEVVVTVTGAQKKAEIANTVASVDIATKAQETPRTRSANCSQDKRPAFRSSQPARRAAEPKSASAVHRRCRSATRQSCMSTASR